MPRAETAHPLRSEVALVIGASSGLGRAPSPRPGPTSGSSRSGDALPLPLDLADTAQLETAIAPLTAAFGGIDILVNAAGIDMPGPVKDLDATDWTVRWR